VNSRTCSTNYDYINATTKDRKEGKKINEQNDNAKNAIVVVPI
jgi:hypothetical protein